METNPQAWIEACAARLRQQWPTVAAEDLREVASGLAEQPRWRQQQPDQAATAWLRQGIPSAS